MSFSGSASPTPQRITEILCASGRITATEHVTRVRVAREYQCTHLISHLVATVRSGAGDETEIKLLFKCSAPGQTSGGPEVDFYSRVQPLTGADLLVSCHSAEFCAETKQFSLLLDDLAPEWFPASSDPLNPPAEEIRPLLLDALLRFHATWWNAPELRTPAFRRKSSDETAIHAWMMRRDRAVTESLPHWQSLLEPEVRQCYEQLLHTLPHAISRRLTAGRHLTLIHGDAHGGNFLVGGSTGRGVKLIDWPNWRPGMVTDDLCYLIGAWPDDARHAALEELLPGYYHALLEQLGAAAADYGREEWHCDLELSSGWTLVYAVGLLAEAPAEWAVPVICRTAALESKCRRDRSALKS